MTLLIDQQGPIIRVNLNRPNRANALNQELLETLTDLLQSLDKSIRVVVLSGQGKHFCAGADISYMRSAGRLTLEENIQSAECLFDVMHALDRCSAVVIGQVQGHVLGGGVGLVASCDMVVALENACFGFPEVRRGLVPAVISPWILSKIGKGASRRYFLSGEIFDAKHAKALGLIQEVVADEKHMNLQTEKWIGQLLKNGPQAVSVAKQLLLKIDSLKPEDLRRYTTKTIAHVRLGDEAQEGCAAFLDKRPAKWEL